MKCADQLLKSARRHLWVGALTRIHALCPKNCTDCPIRSIPSSRRGGSMCPPKTTPRAWISPAATLRPVLTINPPFVGADLCVRPSTAWKGPAIGVHTTACNAAPGTACKGPIWLQAVLPLPDRCSRPFRKTLLLCPSSIPELDQESFPKTRNTSDSLPARSF